jgi:hypothetical protein
MRARAKLAGVATWMSLGLGCTSYVINRYNRDAPADGGRTNADARSDSDASLPDEADSGGTTLDSAVPDSGPNDGSAGSS